MSANRGVKNARLKVVSTSCFFSVLQWASRSGLIFLQRLIARWAQRRRQAALLSVFTAQFCFERRSTSAYHAIMWVLPRPQYWFENLLNSMERNILFVRLLLLLSSDKTLYFEQPSETCTDCKWFILHVFDLNHAIFFFRYTPTRTRQRRQKTCTLIFFIIKRDAIKSNLSSACLPMSIYWLTTLGCQTM